MHCVLSGHIRGTSVQLVPPEQSSGLLLIRGFRVRAPDAPPVVTCRHSSRLTCRGGLAWNDSIRCFNAHSAPNGHLLRTDSNRVAGDDGARRCALAIEPTRSRDPGELEPSGLRSPRRLGKSRRRWGRRLVNAAIRDDADRQRCAVLFLSPRCSLRCAPGWRCRR